MIIENSFVPKSIILDLNNPETKISINNSWEVIENNNSIIIIFHEKHGILQFKNSDPIFDFMKILLTNKTAVITYFDKNILLDLWTKELYHISNIDNYIDIPKKYSHFFQFLKQYSSNSLSPYDMFKNLRNSSVAIVGLGGLGSNLSVLLSSHGLGNITLIDGDIIEESNLTRQVFYKHSDIGCLKVDVLANHIESNNPDTRVRKINKFIYSYENAMDFLSNHDFVILCADEPRFKIKAWTGQVCLGNNIPLLIMANKWIGPILLKDKSPCYACLGRYHSSQLPYARLALYLDELQNPPRSSFGPQPFVVAGYMSSLVLMYLAGIDRETFLNKRFKINLFGVGKEERVTRYIDCKICGSAIVST